MRATDGHFYGTTVSTVYRFDGAGTVTPVHTLTLDEGAYPVGTLIQAADSYLYGTASAQGSQGKGTIFRLDTVGAFTKLHDFQGADGQGPASELLQASDGNFYGVVPLGGPAGVGAVYRLAPASIPSVAAIRPASGRAAGGTAFELTGDHFQPGATVSVGAGQAATPVDVDVTLMRAISPALAPGTVNDVVVRNGGSSSATLPGGWFSDFLDVPTLNPFHASVEAVFRAGITAGCGGGNYCPGAAVTRAQIAVFLLKAEHGSSYLPPPCAGVFPDVPCPGAFAVDWIEQFHAEGISGGCGGGSYCPGASVTRAQLAVFLLKTLLGSSYVPPTVTQIFDDVPPGSFAADWVNDLYIRAITGGCSASPPLYCPGSPNTRGQMAVFLTRTFNLP
jgi:uncharacterized repeat protein (TIGR03803 family)